MAAVYVGGFLKNHARRIEEKTARINSDIFLWAALGSMASSLALKCLGQKHTAIFVGQWAAPFLLLGLYNKLVKVAGHDQEDQGMIKTADRQG